MLFYNVRLRCYVVVEVKTVEFSPSHIGQLGSYVVAVDHLLRKDTDNKTIGLLVCKTKDNVFAQYALEASTSPSAFLNTSCQSFIQKRWRAQCHLSKSWRQISNIKG